MGLILVVINFFFVFTEEVIFMVFTSKTSKNSSKNIQNNELITVLELIASVHH